MKNGTAVDAETYPHFILRLKLLEEIQDTFGGESVKQCRTYSKPFRPNTETPKKVQQFSKKKCSKIMPKYIIYIPKWSRTWSNLWPKNVSSLLARMEEVLDAREANMVSWPVASDGMDLTRDLSRSVKQCSHYSHYIETLYMYSHYRNL